VSVANGGDITVTHSGTNTVTFASSATWLKGTADAQLKIQDSNSSGDASETGIEFVDSNGGIQGRIGVLSSGNDDLYLGTCQVGGQINFQSGSQQTRLILNGDGHLVPNGNNLYDLGTSGTQFRNAYFDGTVACDGLSCVGSATIESGEGILVLKDTDNANSTNHQTYVSGRDSSNTERWYVGNTSSSSADLNVYNTGGAGVKFGTSNTARIEIDANGHFLPLTNNAYDIGGQSFQFRNAYFDGTVNCDGLSCVGDALVSSSTGILSIRDNDSSGNATACYVRGQNNNGAQRWLVGQSSTSNEWVYLRNEANAGIAFATNGGDRLWLDENGHLRPSASNTYDLGSSAQRWRNVYTNDLNLSNEGGTNDVDGTWGSWTIQEGEDDLFLLNRRNGKKYKFNLSEVN